MNNQNTLRGRHIRAVARIWQGRFPSSSLPQLHNFAAREIKSGEGLIIVTNMANAKRPLCKYKKRWGIECLFADAKRRSFNREGPDLTQHQKFSTLMAIIAIAMSLAYVCASTVMGHKVIKRQKILEPRTMVKCCVFDRTLCYIKVGT